MERWSTTGMVPTDLSDVSLLNANILNQVGAVAILFSTAGGMGSIATTVYKH